MCSSQSKGFSGCETVMGSPRCLSSGEVHTLGVHREEQPGHYECHLEHPSQGGYLLLVTHHSNAFFVTQLFQGNFDRVSGIDTP